MEKPPKTCTNLRGWKYLEMKALQKFSYNLDIIPPLKVTGHFLLLLKYQIKLDQNSASSCMKY